MQRSTNSFCAIICLLLAGSYINSSESSSPPFVGYGNVNHPHHYSGVYFNEPVVSVFVPPIRNIVQPVGPFGYGRFVQSQPNRIATGLTAGRPQSVEQGVQPTEKQLQAYMSGIEALFGSIQELDEAVLQMKPLQQKNCEEMRQSPSTSQPFSGSTTTELSVSDVNLSTTTAARTTTTESLTDPSLSVVTRMRRDRSTSEAHFGMPTTPSDTIITEDQAIDDLARASNDLKALRKDLSRTAEWLKQTNNTVHSIMLRVLQTYVKSIESRVDHQRQVFSQTRGIGLKTKIAAIKEKVASLLDKLKTLVPFKQQQNNFQGSNAIAVGTSPPTPGVGGGLINANPITNLPSMVTLPPPTPSMVTISS